MEVASPTQLDPYEGERPLTRAEANILYET